MAFIRTATFNCAFCRFSATATVSAEIGGIEDALEAARCPHCRRRSARPLGDGVRLGLVVALCVLVHLFEVPHRLWGLWMFVVALAAWPIVVALSFVHTWRRQREVVFAARLPVATARLAAPRRIKV